jgi:hypothetical protein
MPRNIFEDLFVDSVVQKDKFLLSSFELLPYILNLLAEISEGKGCGGRWIV